VRVATRVGDHVERVTLGAHHLRDFPAVSLGQLDLLALLALSVEGWDRAQQSCHKGEDRSLSHNHSLKF
jgi:hypothetical protein